MEGAGPEEESIMHDDATASCFLQSSLQLDTLTAGMVDGAVAQPVRSWETLFIFVVAVLMMATIAVMPMIEFCRSRKRSKIRMAQLCFFYVWIIGGATLFSWYIDFESSHFRGTRHLHFAEAVYLMSQIVSTIGYGDFNPVPQDRVFMAFYVLMSTVMVADFLLGFVRDVLTRVEEGVKETFVNRMAAFSKPSDSPREDLHLWWIIHKPQVSKRLEAMLGALGVLIGMCCIWCLVYVNLLPNELSSWSDGLYMAVITFTTIGFGSLSVSSLPGQALACPLMLYGVASMAYLVYTFSRLMTMLEKSEDWSMEKDREHLEDNVKHMMEEFGKTDDGAISEAEFFVLSLLQANIVSKDHMTRINKIFRDLKSPEAGMVTKNQLLTGHSKLALPTKSSFVETEVQKT
eukprot:TRINITY_DN1930_c0_g1_i1.p1 TRINITY_DN1930_c0_g1~~TRINITY_DN1930_c0_g1_i1.p1  ORF type:complete len:403 (+),score=51.94 TRINITY_DN1930_c0_g1_i1:198-1406(+)